MSTRRGPYARRRQRSPCEDDPALFGPWFGNGDEWRSRCRRFEDMIELLLGGRQQVSAVQSRAVRQAAALVVAAEEARAEAFRRGIAAIDIEALVRLEGAMDRAVRGITAMRRIGASPSLAEYLDQQGEVAA